MTIMVYVYCPLSVVTSHHFLPSCTQIGVTLNDVRSFPAKSFYVFTFYNFSPSMSQSHSQSDIDAKQDASKVSLTGKGSRTGRDSKT